MTRLETKLNTIDACGEAIDWASTQKGSFQKSWDKCPRGDWLLWLLVRSKSDNKKIVLASCKIARTVLKYIPTVEKRPLVAIQTAEAWVRGEATLEEVREASSSSASSAVYAAQANAAYYAAYASAAASADAAYYAAYASAAASADAAYYAAYASAAANAADAAEAAAAYAAANTNYVAAKEKSLLKSSKIIRKFFPKAPRF